MLCPEAGSLCKLKYAGLASSFVCLIVKPAPQDEAVVKVELPFVTVIAFATVKASSTVTAPLRYEVPLL